MKKYVYYLLAVLVVAGFVACSEDNDFGVERESRIHIVKSDVLFQAAAGIGTVEFEATGLVGVETDRDWCTATVSGNTVNVAVTENGNLEGRSAQLTLRCGEDAVHVTVQQTGLVFQLSTGSMIVADSNKAHTLTYKMTSNVPLNFESSADWFSVTVEGEHLLVTFKENNTGHARIGNLMYSSNTVSQSLQVVQYEFDKDIAGPCLLTFTTAEGEFQYLNAVLSETELSIPALKWSIPVVHDKEKARLVMHCGQYMGDYSNYKVYNVALGGDYITWSEDVYVNFPIAYDEKKGITYFNLQDGGSWSYPVEALWFYAFTGEPSSDTMAGWLFQLYDASIWRYDPQ